MAGEPTQEFCLWTEDGEGSYFSTECGYAFELTAGTPKENRMLFCCYCGKTIDDRRARRLAFLKGLSGRREDQMSRCSYCEEIMEGDAPGTCEDCVNGDTVILRGPIGEVRRTTTKKDLAEELGLDWLEADKLCTALLDILPLYGKAYDLRNAIANHIDLMGFGG